MAETTTNISQTKAEAEAVADIVRKHIKATVLNVAPEDLAKSSVGFGPEGSNDVPVLITPTGLQVQSVKKFFDEYRTAPERRSGTAHLVELGSLIDHVNRFKDEDSALFALPSESSPKLTAVFDYHQRCNVPDGTTAGLVKEAIARSASGSACLTATSF